MPLDLKTFCAKNDPREYLQAPFRAQGRIFASNGHCMVSIADDGTLTAEDAPLNPALDKAITRFAQQYAGAVCYINLADVILPDSIACKACKGTGLETVCGDCRGEGWFEHGRHEYECKECSGNGALPTDLGDPLAKYCHTCSGDKVDPYQMVCVGLGHFALRYIRKIKALPDCQFATHADNPAKEAAIFRFTGGWGAIMPCRAD